MKREGMKMKKYTLTYKGKVYRYNGNHTDDIINKFANRKVFGTPQVCNIHLKMYDADTRGEVWAEYEIDNKIAHIEKQKED